MKVFNKIAASSRDCRKATYAVKHWAAGNGFDSSSVQERSKQPPNRAQVDNRCQSHHIEDVEEDYRQRFARICNRQLVSSRLTTKRVQLTGRL